MPLPNRNVRPASASSQRPMSAMSPQQPFQQSSAQRPMQPVQSRPVNPMPAMNPQQQVPQKMPAPQTQPPAGMSFDFDDEGFTMDDSPMPSQPVSMPAEEAYNARRMQELKPDARNPFATPASPVQMNAGMPAQRPQAAPARPFVPPVEDDPLDSMQSLSSTVPQDKPADVTPDLNDVGNKEPARKPRKNKNDEKTAESAAPSDKDAGFGIIGLGLAAGVFPFAWALIAFTVLIFTGSFQLFSIVFAGGIALIGLIALILGVIGLIKHSHVGASIVAVLISVILFASFGGVAASAGTASSKIQAIPYAGTSSNVGSLIGYTADETGESTDPYTETATTGAESADSTESEDGSTATGTTSANESELTTTDSSQPADATSSEY